MHPGPKITQKSEVLVQPVLRLNFGLGIHVTLRLREVTVLTTALHWWNFKVL